MLCPDFLDCLHWLPFAFLSAAERDPGQAVQVCSPVPVGSVRAKHRVREGQPVCRARASERHGMGTQPGLGVLLLDTSFIQCPFWNFLGLMWQVEIPFLRLVILFCFCCCLCLQSVQ